MIIGPATFAVLAGLAVVAATGDWLVGLVAMVGLLWATVLVFTAVLTMEEGKDRRGRAIAEARAEAAKRVLDTLLER